MVLNACHNQCVCVCVDGDPTNKNKQILFMAGVQMEILKVCLFFDKLK